MVKYICSCQLSLQRLFGVKENRIKVLIYIRAEEKELLNELASEYGLSFSRYLVLSALGKLKLDKKGGI